jgi:hypothetical protein
MGSLIRPASMNRETRGCRPEYPDEEGKEDVFDIFVNAY